MTTIQSPETATSAPASVAEPPLSISSGVIQKPTRPRWQMRMCEALKPPQVRVAESGTSVPYCIWVDSNRGEVDTVCTKEVYARLHPPINTPEGMRTKAGLFPNSAPHRLIGLTGYNVLLYLGGEDPKRLEVQEFDVLAKPSWRVYSDAPYEHRKQATYDGKFISPMGAIQIDVLPIGAQSADLAELVDAIHASTTLRIGEEFGPQGRFVISKLVGQTFSIRQAGLSDDIENAQGNIPS